MDADNRTSHGAMVACKVSMALHPQCTQSHTSKLAVNESLCSSLITRNSPALAPPLRMAETAPRTTMQFFGSFPLALSYLFSSHIFSSPSLFSLSFFLSFPSFIFPSLSHFLFPSFLFIIPLFSFSLFLFLPLSFSYSLPFFTSFFHPFIPSSTVLSNSLSFLPPRQLPLFLPSPSGLSFLSPAFSPSAFPCYPLLSP